MGGGERQRDLFGLETLNAAANAGIGGRQVDGAEQEAVKGNGDGIKGTFESGGNAAVSESC